MEDELYDVSGRSGPRRDSGHQTKSRSVGDWLYDLLARYEIVWLIFLLAMVFGAVLVSSRHKHFWYHEIFTIIVASQPSWHRFAQAMPADGQPPVTAILTRLSIHLFGITNFGVRLPETVGFLAALIGVFIFVRREVGAVFGLLAVVLMIAQPAWMYAFEARPYGILLAFLMLGVLSWQTARRAADAIPRQPRRLALAALSLAVFCCILTHHLGLVNVGLPLIFGETARLHRRRRVDLPLVGTVVAAIVAGLAITVPMIHRTNKLLFVHLPPITVQAIREAFPRAKVSFPDVVNVGLLELLAFIAFLAWCPWFLNKLTAKEGTARPPLQEPGPAPYILFAALGLFLAIPITYALMATKGGWYFCRYGIGSLLGIALLFPLLLARGGDKLKSVAVALILFFSFSYLRAFLQNVRHVPEEPGDELVYGDASHLPIVISDPLLYPKIWWYAPTDVKRRLIYLSATPAGLPSGYAFVEAALVAEKPLFSAPLGEFRPFVATHQHFVLDAGTIDADLEQTLVSEGFRVTPLRGNKEETLYDVER